MARDFPTQAELDAARTRRLDNLYAAFERVENAGLLGGAQAAARKAIDDGREVLASWQAATPISASSLAPLFNRFRGELSTLERLAREIEGDPAGPITRAWNSVRAGIVDVYTTVWNMQDILRSDTGSLGAAFTSELPDTLSNVGRVIGKVAGGAADVAGGVAGNVVWEFVKGAWPVLLVLGVLAGGVIVVAGKVRR